jgi:transitional endoplasmic reticulum ATPase
MGEPNSTATPSGDPHAIYGAYCAHSSGLRTHTESLIQSALLEQYPSHFLTSTVCDLTKYAKAGHATATIADDKHPTLRTVAYEAGTRRKADGIPSGTLKETISFGQYNYDWQGHNFHVFVIDGQNSIMSQCDRRWYVLIPFDKEEGRQAARKIADALLLAVGTWEEQNHNEVWVYDQGWWKKDKELWRVVQGSKWEEVILDEGTKAAIMRDVVGFFDAKDMYYELGTPWKVSNSYFSGQCCCVLLISPPLSEDSSFMARPGMERLQLRKPS